jgi:hypothetical protein
VVRYQALRIEAELRPAPRRVVRELEDLRELVAAGELLEEVLGAAGLHVERAAADRRGGGRPAADFAQLVREVGVADEVCRVDGALAHAIDAERARDRAT